VFGDPEGDQTPTMFWGESDLLGRNRYERIAGTLGGGGYVRGAQKGVLSEKPVTPGSHTRSN